MESTTKSFNKAKSYKLKTERQFFLFNKLNLKKTWIVIEYQMFMQLLISDVVSEKSH